MIGFLFSGPAVAAVAFLLGLLTYILDHICLYAGRSDPAMSLFISVFLVFARRTKGTFKTCRGIFLDIIFLGMIALGLLPVLLPLSCSLQRAYTEIALL